MTNLFARPVVLAIDCLLIALIALVATGLVNDYDRASRMPVSTPTLSGPPVPQTSPLQTLLDANLFGIDDTDRLPEPAQHAPPTALDLVLKGVVMAENPDDARAIISQKNGDDRSYGLRDALPGNAHITRVYADRVLLKHNGVIESLQLSLPIGRSSTPLNLPAADDSIRSATITGFREQFVRDPAVLADYISAEAVTLKSGETGWLLSPGTNSDIFEQLGLKQGDLVMAINDVAAGGGMSRIALLNELATADQLQLKVLRKEKVLSFYFTMDN